MSAASSARKAAKYAKQTRNAARVTAVATVVSARDQRKFEKQKQAVQPPALPAGWYHDPYDQRFITWWDGRQWLPQSKHLPGQQQIPG